MNHETTLSQRDVAAVWHPYSQLPIDGPPIAIVEGKGVYLYAEDGRSYIDAISSWWVNLHGHAHPYIAEQLYKQLHKLEHVIFAGFTHSPAIELAERLLSILPDNQRKIFYSDNGSTAVEIALKMCLQYWHNTGQCKKKIIALKDAYHGDTFGTMSVSARSNWTKPFENYLFEVIFLEVPNELSLKTIKEKLYAIRQEVACFIYEPLVQGSAGMKMYEASHLSELLCFCKELGILLIQDEVFTGFGRTGKLFAADYLHTQPDIMCLSKGLTGGTLPLGVTSCTEPIYHAFLSNDRTKTLFHGHSYTANPLACVAALASLDLLLKEETRLCIQRITTRHIDFARSIRGHRNVQTIRFLGTILAIEWRSDDVTNYFNPLRDQLYDYFLQKGILMRPLGNVIYLLPPYCIKDEELDYIYATIRLALEEVG
ncbi:adenosylmethionine--8-amino-7-oxononanoate transaminase [Olivibacter sp. LS-1]|jgi:adenosylmethionine-8-amino-7-oxononanoate aminotransferase|uniref:adenosylmethionine--8-amino-7-oxononanoate transaminase n=1 Tax=unclassified Olivibacter TaxID=2632301 RepID=UPI0011EA7CCE|nr:MULTISPECIES: adenosylmethionine--8-amino-7-oxononanoate transaminase [unclassified Olivibacter]MDM8175173.1 adenosylmethionine--8-amino-7-oxononanoate transaminase [Olivibacter sp. 47]QEL01943.1 adenosylmethionine--8-amino-7-oxononanoate transaminase [Olivibacter sp. LS-1]